MICKNCATVFLLQILFQVLLLDISFVTYCLFYNLKKKKKRGWNNLCSSLQWSRVLWFCLGWLLTPSAVAAQVWLSVLGVQLPSHDWHLLNNVAKTVFSSLSQVAPLPGFSFHKSPLPLGEFNMCSIGEDTELREKSHCLCPGGN